MELDFSEEINARKRSGPKSGAQTPAKPSEKKKGSDKNKPGSAGEKGSKITFSDKVINALKSKVEDHNKKHPSKKVTLSQLKKVYRRGAGAFSASHRPGMSRGGWAMARVNTFLKMKRGGKVKKSYRAADQDIAKSSYDDLPEPTMEDCLAANIFLRKNDIETDLTEEDIFPEIDEEGFEEYINEESWAAEKNKGKKLNKPFRTPKGPKKFSVYVKNEKGNVVKVNFGDPNMEIKRDDPARRKSFRARHNCENPGPKTKARYWSCKQWRSSTKVQGSTEDLEEELLALLDESDAELTKKQKTLPPALQQKILENKEKSKKDSKKEGKEDSKKEGKKEKSEAAEVPSKYVFDNPGQAKQAAMKMGLKEIHSHKENGKTVFMPGKNHEELAKKIGIHDEESDAAKPGLWENIRNKKKRMGKNYRPAKPGSKDRPSPEALKKAQKSSKDKKDLGY